MRAQSGKGGPGTPAQDRNNRLERSFTIHKEAIDAEQASLRSINEGSPRLVDWKPS